MSIRDIQLAARENLMTGMQVQLTRMSSGDQKTDPIVLENAIRDFHRIAKFLGFKEGDWSPFC